MRLRKFKKETNKKKVIISLMVITLLGIITISGSYAFFQKENEVTFINAKVADFKVYLTDITATSTNNQIDLNYTSSGLNATTTCAFGTTSGTYNLVSTSVNNSKCTKTGLTQNTTYYYKVCSKNNLKQEECKEGNIKTKYNPPTLSTVTATSTTTTIDLSYTESGTVSTRTCKYGTTSGSYTTNANSQTSTKCSLTGLNAGTTYYYQVCVSNNGGQSCKTGSIKTKTIADLVEIGDYISITPTATSYTISKDLTGYTSDQTINPSELNLWRVIRKNSDGTVDMVSDKVSSTLVYFRGKNGYLNLVGGLNTIAAQYTDGKHVQSTRHMGYSDQTETITSTSKLTQTTAPWKEDTSARTTWTGCSTSSYLCGTDESLGAGDIGYETDYNLVNTVYSTMKANNPSGKATAYWLASRLFIYDDSTSWRFRGRYVDTSGGLYHNYLFYYYSGFGTGSLSLAVRPIVTLKSTTEIESGSGTSSSPYVLN